LFVIFNKVLLDIGYYKFRLLLEHDPLNVVVLFNGAYMRDDDNKVIKYFSNATEFRDNGVNAVFIQFKHATIVTRVI
jgi:hypothetical protein